MKAFEEYRTKRIDEWNNQKKRRLELRCSKYISILNKLSILKVLNILSFSIERTKDYCIINTENK